MISSVQAPPQIKNRTCKGIGHTLTTEYDSTKEKSHSRVTNRTCNIFITELSGRTYEKMIVAIRHYNRIIFPWPYS